MLAWTPWQSNEEYYFQLAFRTFSPESFPEFHAAFDKSAGRFAADYIIGSMVSLFGYEAAHTLLRILQCVIHATAFTFLFHALRLSILSSLAAIALFVLFGEELFAGEWLFRGVEAKTFAYGAVVAALGFAVRDKWRSATFLMALATWLHFLVGGFWMAALAVFAYIWKKKIALPVKLTAGYSVLVLPLVIAIGIQQFGQALPPGSPSPSEIWAVRNSHHVAPFLGAVPQWQFWDWDKGIVATFFTLLALTIFAPYARNQKLLALVVFLLSYLLIALAIAFVDRHTLYLSEFMLFRPSSLALLLAIALILLELQDADSQNLRLMRQLSLAALILFFLVGRFGTLVSNDLRPGRQDFEDLVSAIQDHSRPGEIVLAQPPAGDFDDLDVFLPRQLDRPTLVSSKYIPSFPPMVIRWNELREKRRALFAGQCDALSAYPVAVLVVYDEKTLASVQHCGKTVWQHGRFSLVHII